MPFDDCLAELGLFSLALLPRGGGCWLALLHEPVCRLFPPPGFRKLAEFFFSFGTEESALRGAFVEAVVVVTLSSMRRLVTPKVPCLGFVGAVSNDAAFFSFSYSALLLCPAEPLSFIRGPGVLAKAFATFVLVGAKWFAPTTFTLPVSYFAIFFKMSVRTLVTVR